MNKFVKRMTAGCLCTALCLGSVGVAFAQTENKQIDAETKPEEKLVSTKETTTEAASLEATKEETVYVLASADGAVQKIIVSDWIKNGLNKDRIADYSELLDIENVRGEETYALNSDNMTIWDAQGNDIYYQGTAQKELPVDMSVTYTLDGNVISAKELAGKSGKVTIRFDYHNNQYEIIEIDGKEEKIYVPFAMLTGMILDSETFRNVEVSNGKLINDGDHTIVIGMALPGMQQNLDLDKDKIEIPDYVEIQADVTDFSFGMTVTIAANELLQGLDSEQISSMDAADAIQKLTDGMTQLMDGSSALYDGICTLLDKSEELVAGIDKLAQGAKALKDGAGELENGASRLYAGAEELSSGLHTLSSNSADLNNGATQVFQTLLATAASQIRAAGISMEDLTIENYASVLNAVIASLDENAVYEEALKQVTSAVEAKYPEITAQVTEAVRQQVTAQVRAAAEEQVQMQVEAAVQTQVKAQVIQTALGMSMEAYEEAVAAGMVTEEQQAGIEASVEAQMASETVQTLMQEQIAAQMESDEVMGMITANVEVQMASEQIQTLIAQTTEEKAQQAISENMASDAVLSQLTAASEGAKTIIALKSSLDSYNAFYIGLRTYTNGVDSAAAGSDSLSSGANDLRNGADKLQSGADTLYQGILTMQNGMPALMDGINQLKDGAMQLSDGLKQFNESGVEKITEFIDEDLDTIVNRFKAIIDVSKHYNNFSGISDGMDGKVKFIYRTEEINED